VLPAARARRVLEIGALRGETTERMLDDLGPDAELDVIDPEPAFDPSAHERGFKGRYRFHRALSLDVIPALGPLDAALIDGDHNWYTVYNELRLLAEGAKRHGTGLPVLILHDVLWPYGRRDLYYAPERIPAEHRQPWARALAAGPPLPGRPSRDRLLRLPRPPPLQRGGPGLDRGQPLAHRRMLPASQGRSRPRSLPGPLLARLVCPHHPLDAGPGLAGRQQSPGRKGGTSPSSQGMIGYTLPEIRRLLTALIQTSTPDPRHVWSWSRWRRRRQYQARLCHYRQRGYVLT